MYLLHWLQKEVFCRVVGFATGLTVCADSLGLLSFRLFVLLALLILALLMLGLEFVRPVVFLLLFLTEIFLLFSDWCFPLLT